MSQVGRQPASLFTVIARHSGRFHRLSVAALLCAAGLAQASVVYQFDSANYTSIQAPYTTAMPCS